jgi:DNA-binding IclR family transcriptional regulator
VSNDSAASASDSAASFQSVDRAITALEHLARTGESGVTEVAEAIGVHKSTASRLLVALQGRELVEATGDRGRYRLGVGVLRLAAAVGGRLDLASQGASVCAALAAELGETVNLAIRQGEVAVNIHQSEGGGAVTVDSWVGRPTPLHATSSGKVLLAYAPESLLATLGPELRTYTDHTITDPAVLRGQLDRVREIGYATTEGELEVGLNAVAAPVRDAGGGVIAALSVSGPVYRLTADRLPGTAAAAREAADLVSARLGYRG